MFKPRTNEALTDDEIDFLGDLSGDDLVGDSESVSDSGRLAVGCVWSPIERISSVAISFPSFSKFGSLTLLFAGQV